MCCVLLVLPSLRSSRIVGLICFDKKHKKLLAGGTLQLQRSKHSEDRRPTSANTMPAHCRCFCLWSSLLLANPIPGGRRRPFTQNYLHAPPLGFLSFAQSLKRWMSDRSIGCPLNKSYLCDHFRFGPMRLAQARYDDWRGFTRQLVECFFKSLPLFESEAGADTPGVNELAFS